MNKPELLAPAGDLEKLKMAITYGADAVYLGGEAFGLRKASKNFSMDQIEEAVNFAHSRGKKVYVTMNIIPHNEDLDGVGDYAKELHQIGVDAVIVADPGIYMLISQAAPDLEIHISTQASITNYETIMFWYKLGVRRVVLARELSLEEIKEIRREIPEDMELECFIHGAMCISYSGRCLLSNYMTGRDANRGECSHACRWKYSLVEEKRPGQYFPIEETDQGTFIFNSKDLCMIKHIEDLIDAGISSFKIEGRVKSSYYVATVIRSYRMAIDQFYKNQGQYEGDKWLAEIMKASYRDFTTGFYFKKPDSQDQLYDSSSYIRNYDFVGLILDYDKESKLAIVEQRNKMEIGDRVEIFGPDKDYRELIIKEMFDENGNLIEEAPHPQQKIKIRMEEEVEKWDMIRRVKND